MNLGDTKREYEQVIAVLVCSAALAEGLPAAHPAEAERNLDRVRRNAMRRIDEYTTRRFLSVNQRRGLIKKLERLHQQAHDEMKAILINADGPTSTS